VFSYILQSLSSIDTNLGMSSQVNKHLLKESLEKEVGCNLFILTPKSFLTWVLSPSSQSLLKRTLTSLREESSDAHFVRTYIWNVLIPLVQYTSSLSLGCEVTYYLFSLIEWLVLAKHMIETFSESLEENLSL
jgi:hypothetical protein